MAPTKLRSIDRDEPLLVLAHVRIGKTISGKRFVGSVVRFAPKI